MTYSPYVFRERRRGLASVEERLRDRMVRTVASRVREDERKQDAERLR